MDSKKTIIKKKKIIISLCLTAILLLIAIVTLVVILVHNSKKEKQESESGNVGTLYSEENLEGEEGVLEVDIDEPSIMEEQPEEEEPEDNKTVKNDTKPKKVDAPYYIKVNNQANVVTVYKKDSHGKYTVPIKAMICSIGSATPESGTYSMSDKYTWRLLEGNVYGQYACRITGSILFHSVPYEQKDKTTLEWWEYDKLGTKASAGCVRLKVEDAKWIYNNCIPGTKVEFYSDSTPGPLGKPTAKKISNDTEVRNWDPTDPDTNNPWPEYLKKQNEKEEENKKPQNPSNTVTNTITNTTKPTNPVTNNTVANNTVTNTNKPVNNTTTGTRN